MHPDRSLCFLALIRLRPKARWPSLTIPSPCLRILIAVDLGRYGRYQLLILDDLISRYLLWTLFSYPITPSNMSLSSQTIPFENTSTHRLKLQEFPTAETPRSENVWRPVTVPWTFLLYTTIPFNCLSTALYRYHDDPLIVIFVILTTTT